jgi:intein/homing endonuclease
MESGTQEVDLKRSIAGKKGGKRRVELHGNPGTIEGRSLGGTRSMSTHKLKRTGFKILRKIIVPQQSVPFAELLGIFMGDGHVGEYQASVVTNSETDLEHAHYIQQLLKDLFGVPATLTLRKDKKACTVLASSKELCNFFEGQGIPKGNKLRKGMRIPQWVDSNRDYRYAFVRGLIDTDGCVYFDRHRVKEVSYSSVCIAFTNASNILLSYVEEMLKSEGLHPTRWGRNIRLRRRSEVLWYAREIGFSNPKHAAKITV